MRAEVAILAVGSKVKIVTRAFDPPWQDVSP
jgi:hypothetical protein